MAGGLTCSECGAKTGDVWTGTDGRGPMVCWPCARKPLIELDSLRTTLARLTAEVGSLRGELATVRDELAKCADAVSGYFNDGDSVSDTVQVVADALGHAKAAEHGLTAERDEALADVAAAEAPLTDIVLRHHAAMSQVERERDEARGLLRDAMALVGQYENAVESASRMYHNTQEWGSDKEIEAMFQAVYDERGRIAAHLGRSE